MLNVYTRFLIPQENQVFLRGIRIKIAKLDHLFKILPSNTNVNTLFLLLQGDKIG